MNIGELKALVADLPDTMVVKVTGNDLNPKDTRIHSNHPSDRTVSEFHINFLYGEW